MWWRSQMCVNWNVGERSLLHLCCRLNAYVTVLWILLPNNQREQVIHIDSDLEAGPGFGFKFWGLKCGMFNFFRRKICFYIVSWVRWIFGGLVVVRRVMMHTIQPILTFIEAIYWVLSRVTVDATWRMLPIYVYQTLHQIIGEHNRNTNQIFGRFPEIVHTSQSCF